MTILFESAIRVTLIAAVIALVLLAMRIKTASVLHAVWASVVVLMMLLPVWVAWGPRAPIPVLAPEIRQTTTAIAPLPIPPESIEPSYSPSPVRKDGGFSLLSVYLLGVSVLLLRLAIGTIRASRLSTASCVVPVTVGLLRPKVILPESSRDWPQAQLDAVLAHEGEHVRRRDPLFQWLALLNRAIFWFHPLAWWLERRLSGLAEEACDAAVLSRGYDPRAYSEYLLDLARSVRRAGTRVNAVGMAMPGIGLAHRIRRMLSGVPMPRVSRQRVACTGAVCAAAAAILAVGTLVHAQSKSKPEFEVASIRPSNPNAGGGDGNTKGGGGVRQGLDHGRFVYTNSAFGLIAQAYGVRGCRPREETDCVQLSGGPSWLAKDRFDIQAKMPDGSPDYTMIQFLNGKAPQIELMLQSLLADRFNLKVHRERKQLPVYALTVATRGLKIKKSGEAEIVLLPDGSSGRKTALVFNPAPLPNGERSDHTIRLIVKNRTMEELAESLSRVTARPVQDRTGLKGEFDFTVDFEKDADVPDGSYAQLASPSLFTALQEAGLKLESTRGPIDVLVIDHVEQPSEN